MPWSRRRPDRDADPWLLTQRQDQGRGPGSFAVALLDELALIEPADLAERVRIS